MTYDEFDSGLQKLSRVYGARYFPTERADILFKTFRHYSPEVWRDTIGEVIGEFMSPPALTKIKEVLYRVRKRYGDDRDQYSDIRDQIAALSKTSSCKKCIGSGVTMAYKKKDAHQYVQCFCCSCAAGDLAIHLPENRGKIRQWNIQIEKEWQNDFENVPDGDRNEARAASSGAIAAGDLNVALTGMAAPRKPYKDDLWQEDL